MAQEYSIRSHCDLRHTMNRSRGWTLSQNSAHHEEEASFTDPTYHHDTSQEGVEACIEDLKRQIGGMAKNLGCSSVYDDANTKTELPFSTQITRFAILHKFK